VSFREASRGKNPGRTVRAAPRGWGLYVCWSDLVHLTMTAGEGESTQIWGLADDHQA
jgi:hypothetical protein